MRLINAGALHNVFERYRNSPHTRMRDAGAQGMQMVINACIEFLDNAETIDAVEVVRCKDCKRRGTENCAMTFNTEDNGYYLTDWTSDDGFCSWGKRKEDE